MKATKFLAVVLAAGLTVPGAASFQAGAKDAGSFAPYEGTYALPSGELILVTRVGVIKELAKPVFLDWQTGRYDSLIAVDADRFTSPSGSDTSAPVRTEIVFSRKDGGNADGLTIREAGFPERRALRTEHFSDRDASFQSGEVALAATLRVPKGPGPFPAVVLVHGSGPGERTQLSLMNAFFAGLGMAVLTYDKRGCGASGGDWKKVDLDVLAEDALAGVRWLKAQDAIDAKRLGLWGISQGGWITPLAGSLDQEVDFVINTSGPATSLRRQDTYNMSNTLQLSGFTDDEVSQVLKGLNVLYDFGQGKASAAELDAVMDQARAHPKLKVLAMPHAKEISVDALYAGQQIGDPAWYFHLNPDNDALIPYRRLKCPVLVTYGRLDYTVPVEESVGLLDALAAKMKAGNMTIKVIPDSGHGYLRMQSEDPRKPLSPQTISRAFFFAIEEWLRANRII